ncbi:unnamed protein product [Adineta steineri]|uniref:Uncharacterized protein n=2 Tax=Adineta steineri TaxID=433720 RepID=A0A815GAA5_9BILA|nr:unnamed protein product [Adineta steineri]
MGPANSKIDPQLLEDISTLANDAATSIPTNYAKEHARIVIQMTKASPEPYEDLLLSDYPEKNLSKVNALALKYATTKEAKQQISNDINEKMKPKVEAKIANLNPLAQKAVRKAVKKSIEEAVDKSVDEAIKKIDTKDKPTKYENHTTDRSIKSEKQ